MPEPHICGCGDCNPEPYDDRCRFELALSGTRLDRMITVRDAIMACAGIDSHGAWDAAVQLSKALGAAVTVADVAGAVDGQELETSVPERFEYRLRWQRVGLQPTSKILQTEKGVLEKADRMLELDQSKGDALPPEYGLGGFAGMPDLVWMRLERRAVGEWTEVRAFDVPEPDPDSARPREHVVDDDVPF